MFDLSAYDLTWLDDASCADMDENLFFVEAGHVIAEDTLNVCRRCPVRRQCIELAYKMVYKSGYFGGLSPGQRRNMTLEEALAYADADVPTDADPAGETVPAVEAVPA